MTDFNTIGNDIVQLRQDNEDFQTQIYIVAGSLGGVCLVLLLCIIALLIISIKLRQKIKRMEEDRKIAAEINARKYSAYTGEEVHRRLQTTVSPTPATRDSEYAFSPAITSQSLKNN